SERIRSLETALKESETGIEQLRSDRESFVVVARQSEAIRKRLITEFFPTFVQRLLQSKEYKESVGEVFSLAMGKGAYRLNPSELQNVMPDGAGPTLGGGPRSSPTAHS
ncbi:hypothetical protein Tco_0928622, partial [Tanacetum coccineum]